MVAYRGARSPPSRFQGLRTATRAPSVLDHGPCEGYLISQSQRDRDLLAVIDQDPPRP